MLQLLHKCPQCCRRFACGGLTTEILASLGPKGFKSKGSIDPEGRVQSSIQVQTSSHQGTSDQDRICQSPQEQLPVGGIAFPPSEAVEKVRVQSSLGFYNRLFIVPKPNKKWRPILDLSALNRFLKVKTFKMETPESFAYPCNKESG